MKYQPNNREMNPSKGRARGSRNKLGAGYFDLMLKIAFEPVRQEPTEEMSRLEVALREELKRRPQEFLKGLRSTLPAEIEFTTAVADMTDAQLDAAYEQLKKSLEDEEATSH